MTSPLSEDQQREVTRLREAAVALRAQMSSIGAKRALDNAIADLDAIGPLFQSDQARATALRIAAARIHDVMAVFNLHGPDADWIPDLLNPRRVRSAVIDHTTKLKGSE